MRSSIRYWLANKLDNLSEKQMIDKMVMVSEEWIAISILRLIEWEKAVVEGGGAAGVAAIIAGLVPELKGKK